SVLGQLRHLAGRRRRNGRRPAGRPGVSAAGQEAAPLPGWPHLDHRRGRTRLHRVPAQLRRLRDPLTGRRQTWLAWIGDSGYDEPGSASPVLRGPGMSRRTATVLFIAAALIALGCPLMFKPTTGSAEPPNKSGRSDFASDRAPTAADPVPFDAK